MKFIAYSIDQDEAPYVNIWAQQHGIEVKAVKDDLTAETAALAAGYDGVSALQMISYDAATLAALGQQGLRFLAVRNVGTDNVDFSALNHEHIRLSNVPVYSPNAIAEFAVTLMLTCLRNLPLVTRQILKNNYHEAKVYIGRELQYQTVGVVGTGHIGQEVIRILNGFGAKVIAYDPFPLKQSPLKFKYVDFDTLIKEADIVDLHVPGIATNHHLINTETLSAMKDQAILINTARGNLVDTPALLQAIKSHALAGAGLDTFEDEPAILTAATAGTLAQDSRWQALLNEERVMVTPHIAYYTDQAVQNMVYRSLDNLKAFVETGHGLTEVTKK